MANFLPIFLGSTPRKIVLPPVSGNARALHNFVCTRVAGRASPRFHERLKGVCRPRPPPAAAVSARPRCSPLSARSVRSLSPFGERAGVRGLQDYREIRAPHPTPLQPKSDVSDFGPLWVPNSGKPEFGWGEGARGGRRDSATIIPPSPERPSGHPAWWKSAPVIRVT